MADNTIDRLKSQLLRSGLQVKDQVLFQIINQLIDAVAGVAAVTGSGSFTGGGSGGSAPSSGTFLTESNESVSLPNSRQEIAGPGIEFNDSPANRRVILVALPFNMGDGGEGGEDGPPGPPGPSLPGPIGPPGPQGADAVSQFYGFDGIDGEDAPILPGPTGPQGIQGQTGSIGMPGIPGDDGEDGLDSFIPGPMGPIGPAGPGVTTLKTTGNQTINAGAGVFTDITGLTFPVVNGVDYAFYFYIVFQSAALTTGYKAAVNHPGGTLDFFQTYQTLANATSGNSGWLHRHNTAVDDMTLLTSTVAINVDLVVMMEGRYQCTANGTFAARFANELAANTDITVRKGSWGFYF